MTNPLRPIGDQFSLWWKTVFNQETIGTYQKTIQVTVDILKETGKLIWLVLCFGLVLFQWLIDSCKQLWQQSQSWYDSIEEPKGEHLWQELSKVVSDASRSSVALALGQARGQLGLPVTEPKVAPAPKAQPVASAPANAPEPPAPKPVEVKAEAATDASEA
jgi:predicted PurR-regulated permease PerM